MKNIIQNYLLYLLIALILYFVLSNLISILGCYYKDENDLILNQPQGGLYTCHTMNILLNISKYIFYIFCTMTIIHGAYKVYKIKQ